MRKLITLSIVSILTTISFQANAQTCYEAQREIRDTFTQLADSERIWYSSIAEMDKLGSIVMEDCSCRSIAEGSKCLTYYKYLKKQEKLRPIVTAATLGTMWKASDLIFNSTDRDYAEKERLLRQARNSNKMAEWAREQYFNNFFELTPDQHPFYQNKLTRYRAETREDMRLYADYPWY